MKPTFPFMFLGLFFLACACTPKNTNKPDNSLTTSNSEGLKYFQNDIAELTAEEMQKNKDLVNVISLDQSTKAKVQAALLAFYNSKSEQRNQVIDLAIHAFPRHIHATIDVLAKEEAKWASLWTEGVKTIGIKEWDELFAAHQLSCGQVSRLGKIMVYKLNTPTPINTKALINKLQTLDGVQVAEISPIIGDGNKIFLEFSNDLVLLKFSYGFGDCPAGCTERRFWEFSVDAKGNVKFIKEYGDPLPTKN